MYAGMRSTNQRNRSTSYFSKRTTSNSRTFSRLRVNQEKNRVKLQTTPLYISASSWIVITPEVFKNIQRGVKVNVKSQNRDGKVSQVSRLQKINVSSSLLDIEHESIMYGNNWSQPREIASLTKVMTGYTVLKIMEKYSLNKHSTLITVSKRASGEIGTSANLVEGHTFSIWDLLHGLMLPSGNDAAIALAEYFGKYLLNRDKSASGNPLTNQSLVYSTSDAGDFTGSSKTKVTPFFPEIKSKQKESMISDYSFSDASSKGIENVYRNNKSASMSLERSMYSKSYTDKFPIKPKKSMFSDSLQISRFILEMNRNAEDLNMRNTHFDSPHGLANFNNLSTAYDIALLCSVGVMIPDFNRITRTKSYTCKSRNKQVLNLSKTVKADYQWVNTNKLLSRGFVGIKTGVTQSAGPCLATYLKKKKRSFIVVLLNCKSLEQRWIDTYKIIEHCQMKINGGLTQDMAPNPAQDDYLKDSGENSLDLSHNDIKLIHLQSSDEALKKNPTSNSFFKKDDYYTNNDDEDGSTEMSSSSPICTYRKSLF